MKGFSCRRSLVASQAVRTQRALLPINAEQQRRRSACDCQRDPGIGLLRTRVERPHKDGAIATEREEKSRRFPPGIGSAAQWQPVVHQSAQTSRAPVVAQHSGTRLARPLPPRASALALVPFCPFPDQCGSRAQGLVGSEARRVSPRPKRSRVCIPRVLPSPFTCSPQITDSTIAVTRSNG